MNRAKVGEVPRCSLAELPEGAVHAQYGTGGGSLWDEDEMEERMIAGSDDQSPAQRAVRAAAEVGELSSAFATPPRPPVPLVGLQHLTPDNLDETSTEGRIFKLERRLKRNLPNHLRASLESQLKDLKYERDHPGESVSGSPAACRANQEASSARKSALNTGARRKVGTVAFEEPHAHANTGDQVKKKTKKVNKAAPVIQHPQTMHRMQDWKAELDRRIREQQELDAQSSKGANQDGGGWLGSGGIGGSNKMLEAMAVIGSELQPAEDSPLLSLGKALSDSLSHLTSMLGQEAGDQEQPPASTSPPALPPQTFSRRL
jgi:hypothetical protein